MGWNRDHGLKAQVRAVDPARMTDARSTLPTSASRAVDISPGIRTLTAAEVAHLDRARAHLGSADAIQNPDVRPTSREHL